ncbi:hypothetical protein AJ79_09737 [Helicocarpus griseus UAMH5409]|uniref:Uncharacterized protein n=1 Tax=Helicocarpus griseus UAMH5409 TaxID=1447875 RepID=A0A2B7WHX5_9EURO|nr:hypothetical protein AJ79_09737 [Helicocarpus griseus UAMH5409]
MAFPIEDPAIWCDVTHQPLYVYLSSANYAARFEEFYNLTVKRTGKWLDSLPHFFSYGTENLGLSIEAGRGMDEINPVRLPSRAPRKDCRAQHETGTRSSFGSSPAAQAISTLLTRNTIVSTTNFLSAGGSIRDAPCYLQLLNASLHLIPEAAREKLRVMEPRVQKVTDALRAHDVRQWHARIAFQGCPLDIIMIHRSRPTGETAA